MKNFFYKLPRNIANCFGPKNLLWQGVAFLGTYILVVSGFDWRYFLDTRGEHVQAYLFPAAIIGFFVPVFGTIAIYLFGRVRSDFHAKNTAYAVGQAGILGLALSSFYKVFTGRTGLPRQGYNAAVDLSRGFRFGFYRGGAFQGWPSSHTAVAFAMSFALITLYPKNKRVRFWAIVYALYIGIGVSVSIHWFSDFFAGAIIGALIGISVGRAYLLRREKPEII